MFGVKIKSASAIVLAVLVALSGCRQYRSQPGADGLTPSQVVMAALSHANRQRYENASKYLSRAKRQDVAYRYKDDGGHAQFWDYMTSMHTVAQFEVTYEKPSIGDSVVVGVQKTRTNGVRGPVGRYILVLENGVWRIN